MTDTSTPPTHAGVWETLRRRKVVQWGVAYAAGAWGFQQGLAYVSTLLDWPVQVQPPPCRAARQLDSGDWLRLRDVVLTVPIMYVRTLAQMRPPPWLVLNRSLQWLEEQALAASGQAAVDATAHAQIHDSRAGLQLDSESMRR